MGTYPNIGDSLFGSMLGMAMVAFIVSAKVCRHRIDAWALDDKRRKKEAKRYFQLIPPVEIMMRDWRVVGRFRDGAGYVLCGCLVYFIGRGISLAFL